MENGLIIKMSAFTIDCAEPLELAKFYAELLGWIIPFSDDEYVSIAPPEVKYGGYPTILFQKVEGYIPPVWPDTPGKQRQMAHLDFAVNDVEKAVEYALKCGARVAEKQFSDGWRVMLDPAGHPFCLCDMKAVIEGGDFALL
jgi:predicted enzyme related to lactoylglutathione lyase